MIRRENIIYDFSNRWTKSQIILSFIELAGNTISVNIHELESLPVAVLRELLLFESKNKKVLGMDKLTVQSLTKDTLEKYRNSKQESTYWKVSLLENSKDEQLTISYGTICGIYYTDLFTHKKHRIDSKYFEKITEYQSEEAMLDAYCQTLR